MLAVSSAAFSAIFIEHWAGRVDAARVSELESALAAAVARGCAALPGLAIPAEAFVAFLAKRAEADRPPAAALAALPVADLFLACACARGERGAAEAFDRVVLPAIEPDLRGIAADADVAGEILQRVREHLLVARPDGTPRIVEYLGRGPLAGWVRIVALRIGLQMLRAQRSASRRTDELANAPMRGRFDPELEYIREHYRAPYKEAVEQALRDLSVQERNLLQLHVLDGVSLSQIGALHQVNKSTVSRWLSRARAELEAHLRRHLQAILRADAIEIESLLGLFHSDLDLSIERIFEEERASRDAG